MNFSDFKGNKTAKEILNNSLKLKNISHAYIIHGGKGSPKAEFARIFAEGILCKGEDKPCRNCRACLKFKSGNHPDFLSVGPLKDKKTISVEQIREILKYAYIMPNESEKRVYIINDAHLMTVQAQNALLKFFEEPPSFSVIILVTEDINMLLTTIRSRGLSVKTDGNNDNFSGNFDTELEFIDSFSNLNELECLDILQDNLKKADDMKAFLQRLKIILSDICIIKNVNNTKLLNLSDKELQISEISFKITDVQSQRLLEICDDYILRLEENSNFKITLYSFNAKCWEEIH